MSEQDEACCLLVRQAKLPTSWRACDDGAGLQAIKGHMRLAALSGVSRLSVASSHIEHLWDLYKSTIHAASHSGGHHTYQGRGAA